ncbi:tripartite motif-containing protein 16-like protein [Sphaeramia orbicularis]|uniref:Tripartite motif-containing protein 16-like protein n=1 Tax=Sphaeramia orbicularis TaxID=375764 RepID=A0A673BR02_9TELE|nr:tripartite motif-containing protein 16-like protein [Sphaeramia orbicularis]
MAESRRDLLCCGICHQLLRNPATLPCGHSFCMQCITCSLNHNERNKSPCRCPECGRVFASRPQLNKNTTVAQKRPWRCMETEGPSCWKHQCPLDVYCCTDEQVICATCASVDHRGHTIGLVREERKRKQEQLMMMKRKSKKLIQRQEEKLINNREILQQIEEKAREIDDYCESILAGVIDSLQKHYVSVRELISTLGEKTAAQVQTNMKNLELKKKAMKTQYAELDQLAQTDSDVHFLLKWPSQCYDVQADHFHVSSDPLLPFVSIKTAVEKLGNQLEALCNKEFGAIVQTVRNESQQEFRGGTEEEEMQQRHEAATPESYDFSEVSSTNTQPTVEPKTREEFLRYACELTLDPTTAHKDLLVSENDKKVQLCPQTLKGPSLRNPERFLHRRQVLCREGLQAERCYYEVEVTGGKAEIALAYKGIDRKSSSKMSAFGGDVNSWSLDCSTNYSVSHRSDSIQLLTPPGHDRIGIYLAFKEGTLSFYEVSDCMKFLYKTEATFTEPLYPGFWLGEKCRIRICDLRNDTINQ